jgi:hypothetical protein
MRGRPGWIYKRRALSPGWIYKRQHKTRAALKKRMIQAEIDVLVDRWIEKHFRPRES